MDEYRLMLMLELLILEKLIKINEQFSTSKTP
jgi:hypothetical protein